MILFMEFFFIQLMLLYLLDMKSKKDWLILLQPLIFVFLFLVFPLLKSMKAKFDLQREEKKVIQEIPNLVDFLRSYLMAGFILPNAITAVLKQKKWSAPIQYSLTSVSNHFAQGKSFRESLSMGIEYAKAKKSRQYLCLLYLSLRLGSATGENLTHILEKMKHKTQDRLGLERKLRMTTAQMRLQALVITLAPSCLGGVVYLLSPDSILFFFQTFVGNALLILMIILNSLGAYFIFQILKIK
jgi:tight adherence protein B